MRAPKKLDFKGKRTGTFDNRIQRLADCGLMASRRPALSARSDFSE
jgi:hypothetical protein